MQETLLLRSRIIKMMRDYFETNDFIDVETPILDEVLQKVPEIISCLAGCTTVNSMHCHSRLNSINRS